MTRLAFTWSRLVLGLGLLVASAWALAAQKVAVNDGGSYAVKVSATELSRLSVERGRIEKVWAVNTAWDVRPDKDSGELFVRPKDGMRRAFSFFVRDNFGNTYTLVATPTDIPSETILLQPQKRRDLTARSAALTDQPYVAQIKTVIKDMAARQFDPYLCEEVNETVPLWAETRIVLAYRCAGAALEADVYTLSNVSGKELVMSEKEFANFGERVQAVALERLVLAADEATTLYVVRGLD